MTTLVVNAKCKKIWTFLTKQWKYYTSLFSVLWYHRLTGTVLKVNSSFFVAIGRLEARIKGLE